MRPLEAIAIGALVLLIAANARAQDPPSPDEVFRVNVDLVTVDAAVVNKKTGQAVRPLEQQDFIVYEDGKQQPIAAFSQDRLPLSVVFLFDLTDSVRPVLKPLARGALDALAHLKPEDEVAVMVYAATATLLQDFTTNHALIAAAIEKASKMKSDEAAFFNEGLFQAGKEAERASSPQSRRVVLWLTDNVPNIPSADIRRRYGRSLKNRELHSEKQATEELLRSGTTVWTLLDRSELSDYEFSSRLSHWGDYMLQRAQYPPGDVYRYADQTGGRVMEFNAKHASERLADMIDAIRNRYTLGYRPPSTAKRSFRSVRVRLVPEVEKRLGRVTVASKKGYYK